MKTYKKIRALISSLNKRTFADKYIKNRIKLISNYILKRSNVYGGFPNLVHIELTNICNLRCLMCPLPVMKRKKGFMNINLYKKIIQELSESPVETIALSFYGESLLHKQFPEFLQIAKSAGLHVFMSTNGLMLNEKLARSIINNSLDLLIISYDSLNLDIYKRIRKGGNLTTLNRNVEKFLQMKGDRKPITVLQCIEFPQYPKDTEKIYERWKKFDVRIATRPLHNWLGDVDKINRLCAHQKRIMDYGVCDQPWRHAAIYWDGRLAPCCYFYDAQVVLGDLNKNSLAEIWNDEIIKDFRKKHLTTPRGKIKECSCCRQKAPNFLEKLGLLCFDMATINTALSTTDGWRD